MDIRTKLVFALVAVALASMLSFGALMYHSADRRLRESTEDQLAGLAESRKDALEDIVAGWRERVQLIASRTQLRLSLREHNLSEDPDAPLRIHRILSDAIGSVRSVRSLAVYDTEGRLVAQVGLGPDTTLVVLAPHGLPDSAGDVRLQGVSFGRDERPRVAFVTGLVLDGERLGWLFVQLSGQELVDLTKDYTGLGATGEVLIVAREDSVVRTLHPVRHDSVGASSAVGARGQEDPLVQALTGVEGVYSTGLTDYRDEPVWAATRYVPETGWGLVVKFDAAEQRAAITDFRREMTMLALSLAAFAILAAVALGYRFANPIHNLSETANRIRVGELEARAKVSREDEIGLLATTFNQMADELEERMTLLHEYEKFFEVSLDLLCIAGTDGFFKRTNPAFERTLGWGQDQLLGQPFFDLVHPDDLEATRHEIEKLARGIPTISFGNRFRCADGSYKHLRWTAHPEPESGRLYAVAHEVRDHGASR